MLILLIAPRIPGINAKGDQLVAYYRCRSFIEAGFHVIVVCYLNKNSSLSNEQVKRLQDMGVDVRGVEITLWVRLNMLFSIIFNIWLPPQVSIYKTLRFKDAIDKVAAKYRPALFYSVTSRCLGNLMHYLNKTVVEFVDSEALNLSRRAVNTRFHVRWFFDYLKFICDVYEKRIARESLANYVVSSIDAAFIGKNVNVIANGVDRNLFYPECIQKKFDVIFSGNMNYKPNIEAINWFVERIWPLIICHKPNATLAIVGANPPKSFLKSMSLVSGVHVLGRVLSVQHNLVSSKVAIAPMRSGSGMQNKILEAMACGVPVVVTTLGLGDIKANDGVNVIVADDPSYFAKQVVLLLDDSQLRKKIIASALDLVKEKHDWNKNNSILIESIKKHLNS